MKSGNLLNASALLLIVLTLIVGCKSKEERERDERMEANKKILNEKIENSKKTVDVLNAKKDEWAKMSPPEKISDKLSLNGKAVIVYRWAGGESEIKDEDIRDLGDVAAREANEAKTILQVSCFEIKAGEYTFQNEEKTRVPAFFSRCETSLVDAEIPAVVHRKTFENKKIAETLNVNPKYSEIPKKVVAPNPYQEMRDFLKSLPKK